MDRNNDKARHSLSTFENRELKGLLVKSAGGWETIENRFATTGHYKETTRFTANKLDLKGLFFTEDWVYIVCDLVASKLHNQKLKVYRRELIKGRYLHFLEEGHPLQESLEDPNEFHDYHSWMYVIAVDLVLMGNAVLWATRTQGTIPIPAENIELEISEKRGVISGYLVIDPANPGLKKLRIRPSEIIHVKRPNPSSYYWGLSAFVPGSRAVLFNRFTSEFLNNYYIKGAQPQFAIKIGNANERSALRLLRSFEQAYTGRQQQRRPIILPAGVDITPTETKLGDQKLSEYVKLNRETVINLLGAPKHEFSINESGSMGSEETKQALKNFWARTLLPSQRLVAGNMTKHYRRLGKLDRNHLLMFDNSDVEILQEDKKAKAELAREMLSVHTINEVRAELYSIEPHPDGDALGPKPFEQSVVGREPAEEEPEEKALTQKDLKLDDWFETKAQIRNAKADQDEEQITELGLNIYLAVLDELLSVVSSELARVTKSYASLTVKEFQNSSQSLKNIFLEIFSDYEESFTEGFTNITESSFDYGFATAFETPFSKQLQHTLLSDSISAGDDASRAQLRVRGIKAFSGFSEATTESMMGVIEAGLARHKAQDEILIDLKEKVLNANARTFQLRRMGRTESYTAQALGKESGFRIAAKENPDLRKMWLTSGSSAVRDEHIPLHRETVGINETFSNGLRFPHDPNGSAKQVVNCVCDVVIVGDQSDA